MWSLKEKLKKRALKASITSTTTAAKNSAPTLHAVTIGSGGGTTTASLANSQAASAAVAELTAGLDFVFDDSLLRGEDEPGDLVRLHLERLSGEAAKYSNSRLVEGQGEEWTCSHALSKLIQAASRCSAMVYNPPLAASQGDSESQIQALQLDPVLHRTPSLMGTVKATSLWKIPALVLDDNSTSDPGWTFNSGKTLMVAIRGTATKADHMVNMNGEPRDAGCLFNLDGLASNNDKSGIKIQAHTGFLTCALALLPTLQRDIAEQLSSDPSISNVVFTGHSAGGAVASLLFLHFVTAAIATTATTATTSSPQSSTQPREAGVVKGREKVKYSLLTFGSAPCVTISDVGRRILGSKREKGTVGVMMALINEYDMVSRADKAYIRSVVDLYRGRYGLPPLTISTPGQRVIAGGGIPKLEAGLDIGSETSETERMWHLPRPVFHLVGDIILFRLCFGEEMGTEDDGDDEDELLEGGVGQKPTLKADLVPAEEFTKLVFCDIGVHRRTAYLERVGMLVEWARRKEERLVGSLG